MFQGSASGLADVQKGMRNSVVHEPLIDLEPFSTYRRDTELRVVALVLKLP